LADPLVPDTTRQRVQRMMAELAAGELEKSAAPAAGGADTEKPAVETK
jgi:hypothetical protein